MEYPTRTALQAELEQVESLIAKTRKLIRIAAECGFLEEAREMDVGLADALNWRETLAAGIKRAASC